MNTGKVVVAMMISLSAVLTGYSQAHDFPVSSTFGAVESVKAVQIYPNPAVEVLTVKFETPCAKRIKLTVHNIIGNMVEVEIESIDESQIQIKVRDLPTGYYLLSLQDPESNLKSTYKFLKR